MSTFLRWMAMAFFLAAVAIGFGPDPGNMMELSFQASMASALLALAFRPERPAG